MKKIIVLIIVSSLVFISCAPQMNLIQTGETLGKNNWELGGYVGKTSVQGYDGEHNGTENYTDVYDCFSPGFYGRYGITDSIDIGFKTVALVLPFIWDIKYNLIGNKRTEPGFSMSLIGGGGVEDMDGFYQYSAGLVSSYRFNQHLQLYTALKGFRFVGKEVVGDLSLSNDAKSIYVYNGWSLAGTAGLSLETGSKDKVSVILRPEITLGKFWVDKSILKNQDDKYEDEEDSYFFPEYIFVPSISLGFRF